MPSHALILKKKLYAFRSKDELLNFVDQKKAILVALNAEKLIRKDNELIELINKNIGYSDGIGAVIALRKKGLRSIKIAGAELWLDIVEKFQRNNSFYLIGSSQEVIEATVKRLREEFPGLNLVGYRNGYLEPGDEDRLVDDFKSKKPSIIFVAMGSPKQEFVMSRFLNQYPALYMGLGGSFDVYSGNKKRAPKVFVKLGIEWFYRLLREPTRISRQLNLIKFFFKIIFGRI